MNHPLKFGLLFLLLACIMDEGKTQGGTSKSTANSRVQVLDTTFYLPQLKRHRRVWVCLPADYAKTTVRYPVLYLQDGQNVFDAATSFSGEWGVDEALDSLAPQWGECVVVAVDNGGDKRLSEYSPFNFALDSGSQQVRAEGDAYVDFLVHTLRPYLHRNFRIRRSDKAHFIAGSSMGGLIAYYAVLKYPGRWGGAGIFSPAFWIVREQLIEATRTDGKHIHCPLYFYAGQQESAEMVPDVLAIMAELEKVSKAKLTSVIRAEGKHAELSWRAAFPAFYEWMMHQH